jgi:hypothetical protein
MFFVVTVENGGIYFLFVLDLLLIVELLEMLPGETA